MLIVLYLSKMDKNHKEKHPKKGFIETKILPDIKLNLNYKKIEDFTDQWQFSVNLSELYVTHNDLKEVPTSVMTLTNLKVLDISFNKIEYFDDIPKFCHNIKYLNISNNKLLSPPYWIWSEAPRNLDKLDLSYNGCITNSFKHRLSDPRNHDKLSSNFFKNEIFRVFLQYKTFITHIKINNCRLINHTELLRTLSKAKHLEIGSTDLNGHFDINRLEEVPFKGLEDFNDLERINLSNTYIFNVKPSIQHFKNLKEINLSQNKLTSLPKEMGYLNKLEVCILSCNSIMYLPDSLTHLNKLVTLILNSNELCMVPDDICKLPYLKTLDLYDNKLHQIPGGIEVILEVDLAQNYFDEPEDVEYLNKRKAMRNVIPCRLNGCKHEEKSESWRSDCFSDNALSDVNDDCDNTNRTLSSPEDWDSDEYWIPHPLNSLQPSKPPWISFVEKKMAEGNFCPMDAHQVSIYEKVKYEKACYPQTEYESEGQFDDFPDDCS